MKKIFPVLFLVMLACSEDKKEKHEPFPVFEVSEKEWATYEGTIVMDEGTLVDVEISLKENTVGLESYYELKGVVTGGGFASQAWSKYSVKYGLPDHALGVTLHTNGKKVCSCRCAIVRRGRFHVV